MLDPPESGTIARALEMARRLTDMRVAYLAEFREGEQVLRALDGEPGGFGFEVGQTSRLEETYCQRVVDGRLDRVIPDAANHPVTAPLEVTTERNIGAYVGVPVRYPDGRLFGSLCLLDHRPHPELAERDAELLEVLGNLLGQHLDGASHVAQLEARRDELLASVSHDLRTPLMALRFIGEDLRSTDSIDRQVAGEQIERESARVLSMVEDLLLVSHHKAGSAFRLSSAPADLVTLAREAADSARLANGGSARLEVRLDLPDAPLIAHVDANRLLRALSNLLDNAYKYSPGEGVITLGLRDEGPTALTWVQDEGMGVEDDEFEHLQERFWRSPRAVQAGIVGTGLGLSTVQAIADLHEGTLHVRSEPGAGSCFELRLPKLPRDVR